LLVTPIIADLLSGKDISSGFPDYAADTIVGRYTAGHLVTVSLLGDPDKRKPDLERLENVHEVWALCFRKPRPGWRILGRFVQRDMFVGLRAYDRHVLGKKSNYAKNAKAIPNDWTNLLGDAPVLFAATAGEYLSGVHRDVDQEA
jgi:hypothetical protein